MTVPTLYQSSTENMEDLILTANSPYKYWSAYSVIVPNLAPADVININARAEVTNQFDFPVMVGWFIANDYTYGGPQPVPVGSLPAGEDLAYGAGASGQIHLVCPVNGWVTGYTGTHVFSLVIYAASGSMTAMENHIEIEHGCGLIQAAVFKSV